MNENIFPISVPCPQHWTIFLMESKRTRGGLSWYGDSKAETKGERTTCLEGSIFVE